jgi:hypothetical protein
MQVSLLCANFDSFESIPRGIYPGSSNSSTFQLLGTSILRRSNLLHQQCVSVSYSLHPHQYLLLVSLVMAILTEEKWIFNVVWICISFLVYDVEQFLMYLLAICNSSCCRSYVHLFIGLFEGIAV